MSTTTALDIFDANAMAAFEQTIAELDEAGGLLSDDDLDAEARVTSEIVRFKPNADGVWSTSLDGEAFAIEDSSEFYFCILAARGSRALWPVSSGDETEETKKAICRSNMFPPKKRDLAVGIFDPEVARSAGIDATAGNKFTQGCEECPWNQWGSKEVLDETYTGNGKACGGRRTYFVVPLDYVASYKDLMEKAGRPSTKAMQKIGVFVPDETYSIGQNPGIAMLELTEGANARKFREFKQQHDANMKGFSNRMPYALSVFRGKVKTNTEGARKWGSIESEWVGMVLPSHLRETLIPAETWVRDLIDRINEGHTSEVARLTTAATAEAVDGDSAAF